MQELTYQQGLINRSRQELIADLKARLSSGRFEHVLRVEQKALELGQHYQADLEAVSIVALMHDYAKEMDRDEMRQLAKDFWPDPSIDQANVGIWHGFAAAQLMKEQMNCQDETLLTAVAAHTTGWPEMSQLAKILYLADYTEAGRDFKGVNKVRKLAIKNLDQACLLKLRQTVNHLMKKQVYIFPLQINVYNSWIQHLAENKTL